MSRSFSTATAAPVAEGARGTLHVVARVGDERFAFSVADVEEVIDAPVFIAVPNALPGMAGQFAHRGRTVSAFDAGWAFGVERAANGVAYGVAYGAGTDTALILRVAGDCAALIVDDVEDLALLDPEAVRNTPAGADPAGLLRGVCLPRSGGSSADGLIGVVNATAVVARVSSLASPVGG
ncbi:MAG: chemotaxis protein CheW, partial [Gemmatimonadetes bacterium]|nr:chemotaxis protein CheW [Gemmatimonadota bacterium]